MKSKNPPYDEKKYGGFFMRNYRKIVVWGSILTAFFSGILFMNLAGNTYLGKNIISLQSLMEASGKENLKTGSYLYYLIRLRGVGYLVLGLLGQAFGGLIWLILYGAGLGWAEGMLLTSGFVQQRISGVWIIILSQMPHMLIYGLVYVTLVKRYVESEKMPDRCTEEREKRRRYFYGWLMNIPVIMTGILSEFYVNPWCMNWLRSWMK